jgi:hypothetical protein
MSTLEIAIHVEALVVAAFAILVSLSGIASLWAFRKIARLASSVAHLRPYERPNLRLYKINGANGSKRYPLIVEAAARIDGSAIIKCF